MDLTHSRVHKTRQILNIDLVRPREKATVACTKKALEDALDGSQNRRGSDKHTFWESTVSKLQRGSWPLNANVEQAGRVRGLSRAHVCRDLCGPRPLQKRCTKWPHLAWSSAMCNAPWHRLRCHICGCRSNRFHLLQRRSRPSAGAGPAQ